MVQSEHLVQGRLPCANPVCSLAASQVCSGCSLVAYCSRECQLQHRKIHKLDCANQLATANWRPRWYQEGRAPTFVTDSGPPVTFFGGKQPPTYLWGNVPAIDVLNLAENEGKDYEHALHVCFAASGDFRNALQTATSLPEEFDKSLKIVLNDRDIDVVARNIFILLLIGIDDQEVGVDAATHLWYSSRLTKEQVHTLQSHVRAQIENVVQKLANKSDSTLLSKTFTIGVSSVRVLLYKSQWHHLLNTLDNASICETTEPNRKGVVLARPDNLDRHLFGHHTKDLHRRLSSTRFRHHGVLLPFGCDDTEFCESNPTLFDGTGLWMQTDAADPLSGWDLEEVRSCTGRPLKVLKNDTYGDLYFFINFRLNKLHATLRKKSVQFELVVGNAQDLPKLLPQRSFDRVDVSNMTDMCYIGIPGVSKLALDLLNRKNLSATLVSLFINAVQEVAHGHELEVLRESLQFAAIFLGFTPWRNMERNDPEFFRVAEARNHFGPFDKWFREYLDDVGFRSMAAADFGVKMKDRHTIVPKWPYRLKKKPGQDGAQKEFEHLQESDCSGTERYVEWQLTRKVT